MVLTQKQLGLQVAEQKWIQESHVFKSQPQRWGSHSVGRRNRGCARLPLFDMEALACGWEVKVELEKVKSQLWTTEMDI